MNRLMVTAALVGTWVGTGVALALPAAAVAQDVTTRVGKLESEMRAVQRKVFPNGAGQYLQPEVNDQGPPASLPGSPSSSALVDMGSRVTSLEGQMATLTGQVEQNAYRLRQLQDVFDAYRRTTDAKLSMIGTAGAGSMAGGTSGAGTSGAGTTSGAPVAVGTSLPPADVRPGSPSPRGGTASRPSRLAPTAVDIAADAPRKGPVPATPATAGIERPQSGDAAEDDYLFGYRLWQAKQYPAAEVQLKKVVATYLGHRRASYAQNLLGRSYLDDGKPSLASVAFYDNYKKMPDGERAPDSLYYLAQALMKLGKPTDACKVYGELTDVYGAKISGGMKADVAKGRAAAKCQ